MGSTKRLNEIEKSWIETLETKNVIQIGKLLVL